MIMKYRKWLAVNTAADWSDKTIEEAKTSSFYGREYTIKSAKKAHNDFEQAINEFMKSIADVLGAIKNLRDAYSKVSAVMPNEVLIDPGIIDVIEKKNESKREKSEVSENKQ